MLCKGSLGNRNRNDGGTNRIRNNNIVVNRRRRGGNCNFNNNKLSRGRRCIITYINGKRNSLPKNEAEELLKASRLWSSFGKRVIYFHTKLNA